MSPFLPNFILPCTLLNTASADPKFTTWISGAAKRKWPHWMYRINNLHCDQTLKEFQMPESYQLARTKCCYLMIFLTTVMLRRKDQLKITLASCLVLLCYYGYDFKKKKPGRIITSVFNLGIQCTSKSNKLTQNGSHHEIPPDVM